MTARERLASARLYAILDLGYVAEEEAETVVLQLLDGGADLLQLRAKGHDPNHILELARRIQPLCRRSGVPFIVNDYPAVAVAVGADGVHVGQDDGSLSTVRAVVGEGIFVGRSTHSLPQAIAALEEGADYIGFGPLFPTPTKEGRPGIGMGDIAAAEAEVGSRIPLFCIGGITSSNLPAVLSAGARRVVIVSGLLLAPDVAGETGRVKSGLAGER
ncbi:MAG: thiamine phosphate synthase [Verrucomicrobia bacterium]|nr:thiamine phosphate synthase [Verrucomicrobiota bacterium]MDA1005363.1 thiamine phosphate synthase [Verrucomicrobiota bacterium]